MLESDTARPLLAPELRAAPPSLVEAFPTQQLDPLPADPMGAFLDSILDPPSLLVQGPRLEPPDVPTEEEHPAWALRSPQIPAETATEPQPPAPPEASTFVKPELQPPATVPPDVFGIPYPVITPEEPGTTARLKLAKRYALELTTTFSGVYDDNAVISTSSGRKDDFILSLIPELAFLMGTDQSQAAVRVAYAPVLTWYTQGSEKDGVDQNAALAARYKTGKLLVGLNLSAATSSSGGSLDTGQVSESQTYIAALSSIYQFTGKTSVDGTLDETVLKYSGFSSSDETRLQGFGNYQLGAFKLGAGTLIGLLDTEGASSQRYIQPLARVIYAPPAKPLAFNATAGYEFRSLGDGNGQSSDPVFQATVSYLFPTRTAIILNAQRHVFASVGSSGQNYVLTSFAGTIRQQFTGFGRDFFLSFSGGVQHSHYYVASRSLSGTNNGGADDFFFTRIAFDWAFRERCLLGGFYEYSDDSSNRPGTLGFNRNRIGLQLTLLFF